MLDVLFFESLDSVFGLFGFWLISGSQSWIPVDGFKQSSLHTLSYLAGEKCLLSAAGAILRGSGEHHERNYSLAPQASSDLISGCNTALNISFSRARKVGFLKFDYLDSARYRAPK